MSDYLWDRTGESDAEVERLETLLANLRHTPRPLALPPEEVADAASQPRRSGAWRRFVPTRLFEPAWLAAAAALLVTFLLGAGALTRGRVTVDEGHVASHDARQTQPQASSPQSPTPERRESADVPAKVDSGAPVVQDVPRGRAGARPAAFVKSRQKSAATEPSAVERAVETGTLEAMSARGSEAAASLFDGTRQMAKEQLIYALRLTGAKLKEVQSKAHGEGDAKTPPRGGVR